MSMRKQYGCDICRESWLPSELIGVFFKTSAMFVLRDASATDGVHICFKCAAQLLKQLPQYSFVKSHSPPGEGGE